MPCYPLSENTYTVDDTKVFVPFTKGVDVLNERPVGSLLVDIVPFLVVTGADIIVIDPGLGYKQDNGEYHILNNLRNLGYNADDVTKVLLSHLHKDHSTGSIYFSEGAWQLMFPKAHYYVQKGEVEYMLGKTSRSYELERMQFLTAHPQFVALEGDGYLDANISYFVTGGHTPWHQAFIINDGDTTFFYGGDVLPQSKQMTRRFIAKYDYDGRRCADLRSQWAEQAVEGSYKNNVFLFFHDADVPMATLSKVQDAYKINPYL
jgi:glyoxylase-like metal-dependent hydrolase (beta-lactamase superfamily II)